MNSLLTNFLESLNFEQKFKFIDFNIYPIVTKKNTKVNYISLKEAIKEKLITLTEIDNVGSVSEINAKNHSDKKVFIWDGEVLVGAKQDRTVNSSILIKENSELIIPVSCVEQGRWSYKTLNFEISESAIPEQLRYIKSSSVFDSLKKYNSFQSNQSRIWHEIDHISNNLRINSKTLALDDITRTKETEFKNKLDNIKPLKNQCGVIIANQDGILGMEYISKPEVFKDLYHRILKSYIFLTSDMQQIPKSKIGKPKNTSEFIQDIKDIMTEKYKSVGLGNDYRFVRNDIVGSALVYKKSIIHFTLSYIC